MFRKLPVLYVLAILLSWNAFAQEPYKLPPPDVVDILDAPPTPAVSLNPTGELMLLADYEPMPSIAYMSQPMLRLAGMRIAPANNSRQRTTFYTGLVVKRLKDGYGSGDGACDGTVFLARYHWSLSTIQGRRPTSASQSIVLLDEMYFII